MGDNNIFQGKVKHYAPDSNKLDLIELEVEGIGSLYCRGQAAPIGATAACCVRPDLMKMESYAPDPTIKPSHLANHISARIVSIEMTGYVTRVCLLEEKTGKELLYKVRTTDWEEDPYSEGQLVTLRWSEGNCVFLPH
jgi:putative spermidine/putrescine transport system ATP-binding protein